jgi:hypothetical protein
LEHYFYVQSGESVAAEPDQFDLDAAVLRRSESDLRAFMEALAVRLEGALPGRVTVERRRDGLFSKTSHVARLVVRGDKAVYELGCGAGRLDPKRAKLVRGVVISSSGVSPKEWLTEVRAEVQALAERAGAASDLFHDFL